MNEVIDKDGGKGNAVEATLVPFAIPKSIAHLVPALKSKSKSKSKAKAATKPAAKKPAAKKPG
ncbi:hypothetical protein D3C79_1099320 [compost metagenome]